MNLEDMPTLSERGVCGWAVNLENKGIHGQIYGLHGRNHGCTGLALKNYSNCTAAAWLLINLPYTM